MKKSNETIKWLVYQNLRPNKYQFEYSTCEWNDSVVKLKTFWVNCTFLLFILVRFLCLFLRLICKLINKQTKEISARILTFDEEPQQTLNARKMGYPFRSPVSSILLDEVEDEVKQSRRVKGNMKKCKFFSLPKMNEQWRL